MLPFKYFMEKRIFRISIKENLQITLTYYLIHYSITNYFHISEIKKVKKQTNQYYLIKIFF